MPIDFHGLHVATFESRRAGEMTDLVKRFGGRPLSAPATRLVPLEANPQALDMARRLVDDQLETLTYETNQSLYLFSQKAKAEIDRIYTASFGYVEAEQLAESLGKQVEEVAGLEEALTQDSTTIGLPVVPEVACSRTISRRGAANIP